MKNVIIVLCYTLVCIAGTAFALTNYGISTRQVILSLAAFSITLNVVELFLLMALFYAALWLINIISYYFIFEVEWHNELKRSLSFLIILILKNLLPVLIVSTTSFNGYLLAEELSLSFYILWMLASCSFFLDYAVYFFDLDSDDVIKVKLFHWNFVIPFGHAFKCIAVLMWGLLALCFCQKNNKRVLAEEKMLNISQRA